MSRSGVGIRRFVTYSFGINDSQYAFLKYRPPFLPVLRKSQMEHQKYASDDTAWTHKTEYHALNFNSFISSIVEDINNQLSYRISSRTVKFGAWIPAQQEG